MHLCCLQMKWPKLMRQYVYRQTWRNSLLISLARRSAESRTHFNTLQCWLACHGRSGTATAPIYEAREQGIEIEVWVRDTPTQSGSRTYDLGAFAQQCTPHLIVDNAGGHLMQHGLVDICIVGSDRTTVTGDVCNKIELI